VTVTKLSISPLTRISGLLSIDLYLDSSGMITEANCLGEQFRGFEMMLKGRQATDAVYFTQRICGICSMAHGYVAARLVGQIFGLKLTPAILRLQQAMLGAEFLQNHLRHFYLLVLPDYLDGRSPVSSSLPFIGGADEKSRFSADEQRILVEHYFTAMEYSRKCHEMLAIFGGKIPHQHGLVAEGITVPLSADRRIQFLALLSQVQQFIDTVMLPDSHWLGKVYQDYFQIGDRPARYISYGLFHPELGGHFPAGIYNEGELLPVDIKAIRESIRFAWYEKAGPEIRPAPSKPGAYTWVKAPRYSGMALEGGPLARKVISNRLQPAEVATGVMARLVARAEEASIIASWMRDWLNQISDTGKLIVPLDRPVVTKAVQINDAPRGPLLHVMAVTGTEIAGYDIITPTTWNLSPKDDAGNRGPAEEALVGTILEPDYAAAPGRIIRSFDPCLSCATHFIAPDGRSRRRININI
jgi:hydrogenase large subunit